MTSRPNSLWIRLNTSFCSYFLTPDAIHTHQSTLVQPHTRINRAYTYSSLALTMFTPLGIFSWGSE